jgi:Sec7-like guanine-nucleotide exchange factor
MKDVLKEYVLTFDFSDTSLDAAVRIFLESFLLPGEAQSIDAIMESFAERWYSQNTDKMKHQDTAFILAFSIVMLNTDQHNPSIKPEKKMKVEDYIKMNRGIDQGGANVDPELLTGIYHSIRWAGPEC